MSQQQNFHERSVLNYISKGVYSSIGLLALYDL